MVVAVGKGIDRAHGRSNVRPKVRKPLAWDMLVQGWGGFRQTRPRVFGSMDGACAVLSPTVQGPKDLGVW